MRGGLPSLTSPPAQRPSVASLRSGLGPKLRLRLQRTHPFKQCQQRHSPSSAGWCRALIQMESELDARSKFEADFSAALGGEIRGNDDLATDAWASLAGISWHHVKYGEVMHSFRGANDLIAQIRGEGDSSDWYCSSEPGVVTDGIKTRMAGRGWTPKVVR